MTLTTQGLRAYGKHFIALQGSASILRDRHAHPV